MWIETVKGTLINTDHIKTVELYYWSEHSTYACSIEAYLTFDYPDPISITIYQGTEQECKDVMEAIGDRLKVWVVSYCNGTKREPKPEPEKQYFDFDPDEVPF